jgi:phosphoribosylglycinamide formyltransferase-1
MAWALRELDEDYGGIQPRHLSGATHPAEGELDAGILATLRGATATHILLAGYLKKLGPCTLEAYRGRIFNTHPALLPVFGGQGMYGRNVHQAVLESGVRTTGATVHHVQDDYDTGPVIAQTEVPVLPDDTIDTLAVIPDGAAGPIRRCGRIRTPGSHRRLAG